MGHRASKENPAPASIPGGPAANLGARGHRAVTTLERGARVSNRSPPLRAETSEMRAPVTFRAEVVERLRSERDRVRDLGVRHLGLFGSFARDEATEGSDFDLLVEFEPGLNSYRRFMAIVQLLEDVLGREVELVTPEGLSPYLKDEILRSALDVGP